MASSKDGAPTPTDPVLKAVASRHAALLVTGNVHDFWVVGDEVAYRPQFLADELRELGYVVLRYSKSQGARIHNYSALRPEAKQAVDSRLNSVGVLPLLNREPQNAPEELRGFFRGVSRLLQIPADGRPFAVIVEYTEHLAPAVHTSAAAADEHTFVSETLHLLANSPALRKSGNLLICVVREGYQNSLLDDLHRVEIPFAGEAQTEAFIRLALRRGDRYGRLDESLSERELARLTRGLRLREIDGMLREAWAEGQPLSRDRVLEAKAAAIRRASEGTLAVMTTDLTLDDIVGLEVPKRVFSFIADKLKAGDPTSPRAVLMAGPPGTAKSTFAAILGGLCGFNVLDFRNVKNMYVGESERRLRLALSLVETLAPTILFIDEITETTPSRHLPAQDSGVSQDLLAQLFMFSAREDHRGQVFILAASNVPERLDPAWHDRFVNIPFLEPSPEELCRLFCALERRLAGTCRLDANDPRLVEAAQILRRKGVSPRKTIDIINHALLCSRDGSLDPEDVLAAANDYVGPASPMAVAYSSLVAIALTSFQSYLPWSLGPQKYVYPWYLEGVVDPQTGLIDRQELQKRIREYGQCASWR